MSSAPESTPLLQFVPRSVAERRAFLQQADAEGKAKSKDKAKPKAPAQGE
jgi:hypothetical protein